MSSKLKLLGVMAVCLAASLAVSAFAAGSAFALEKCLGIETQICGQGSSLQKLAQNEVWIPGSKLEVAEYEGTGSGAGRTVFGEENANEKPGSTHAPNVSKDTYIGTDEPLTETQMTNGDLAAGGEFSKKNEKEKGQTLVIPVEQAAVAVIVREPSGCKIKEISNANLQKVWSGEIALWHELESTNVSCTGAIQRVAREDVSGTTFVFKTYLNEILLGKTCGTGKSWAEYDTVAENTKWPDCEDKEDKEKAKEVIMPEKSGGGEEVTKVSNTEGSIGYANLADARGKFGTNGLTWLAIQNQSTGSFVFPGTSATEPSATVAESNCSGTQYTGRLAPSEATPDDNWSAVNGAHPGTGKASEQNTNYPICTLTYDVALHSYKTAEYKHSKKESELTKKYLKYVVTESEGQKALAKHDYLKLEGEIGKFAEAEVALIKEE